MVDTLKTAVVVVLLLAVLYGMYVVLNKPEQYPQDIAWETDGDPALQIELGVPEVGDTSSVSSESARPPAAWGAEATNLVPPTTVPSNPVGEASPATMPDHAAHPDLGGQPSLPIPEPTTPAAPAIAAPDLLDGSGATAASASPPTGGLTGEPATGGSNLDPTDAIATAARAESPAAPSEPLDVASTDLALQTSNDRFGASNRYSDSGPLRSESTAEVALGDAPPLAATSPAAPQAPTAGSATANVNDVAESAASAEGNDFQAALQAVHTKIEGEAWYDALVKLSAYYGDATLSAPERKQLVDLLDPLAGKVIYSTEHLIEPAYQSQPGDTIRNIADRYEVPWQLIANINGIENPETLLAGRELKVVRGPFRAEVSLRNQELTLFVGKLYAGRFPISVGSDPAPAPGQYQVNDKQPGRTYYAGNGQTIPIDDPSNPYGRVWIDLGSNLCIHGSSPNGASPGQGCIALTARDAGDIYGILSKGSSVSIVP